MLMSLHVTHKSVDMSCLELIGGQDAGSMLSSLQGVEGVYESCVLRTCNRVEMYVYTDDTEATRRGMESIVRRHIPFDTGSNLVQLMSGGETIRHLFRVASGLESLIVGEDQIQNQVKRAYALGMDHGAVGPRMSLVFQRAIKVGKRVRTQTRLNKGAVSVGSAAVGLAESILGDLSGRTIMILGAGEMATLIAKHLVGKGVKTVFFSNRTYERAQELAFHMDGKALRIDSLYDFIDRTDILLCATASNHMLVTKEALEPHMAEREGRLVIIDVSFPRNVDPAVSSIDGVELHDMAGLRDVAQENIMSRKLEISEAEAIISAELAELEARFEEMRADDVISGMYTSFNEIKEREVARAINRLNGDNADRVIRDFADRMVAQLLTAPTESLKRASREDRPGVIGGAKEIFGIGD